MMTSSSVTKSNPTNKAESLSMKQVVTIGISAGGQLGLRLGYGLEVAVNKEVFDWPPAEPPIAETPLN
jgi:hypothetical protein